ncbi:hypothetical protein SELMODRAFT_170164 [Selaginella moellendorffii]|uniref:Uncharacterized protein GPAT2-1 n=1 Tax=Selaginella moellendorffii TaxID=88036 RepID=D8RCA2_SELML|nr:glycerol-3-phosphate 2-O-acyltransferase 6 [Selaginella moellendorffii]EFJ29816.1 hypothetical protein SELMODRAFT_170164 [Selaginella moellendorffii]|eukprot:XP_002968700.1 glycerol-3-phosphate 2-O-acyltransferase 6 [Selaginella moellendorffii]
MADLKYSRLFRFGLVENCSSEGRGMHTVAADLDGTLLRGRSSFPYFLLVALEGGSLFRAVVLGLLAPIAWLLYHFVSEAAAIQLLIYVSFSGQKVSEIEKVATAVLPKFYSQDVHSDAFRVFSSCGKKYVITANPRIMVEYFCKAFLGADKVIGTEIEVDDDGRATGFVKFPGVLVSQNKRTALKLEFVDGELPEIGLGDRETDFAFMSLCKEAYVVPKRKVDAVDGSALAQRVIFHDGRLVQLPTPFVALVTFLWLPIGFALAVLRIGLTSRCPRKYMGMIYAILGVRRITKGKVPRKQDGRGLLFVCNHRTLVDPIFVGLAAERDVTGLTYSISRVSEVLSPIVTVRLTRDKQRDFTKMKSLLERGRDLCLCPEGTTCREPFLLRFSALFTELTHRIVPAAVKTRQSMFNGTAVRGWKGMDPFFFFMNPFPTYEVEFLEELPVEMSVQKGGKSSFETANFIQKMLGDKLGYECTTFTRKDKYLMLNGSDGTVPTK